jgi:hypothetical protein
MFWTILGSLATVVFALMLFHQIRPLHLPEYDKSAPAFASSAKIIDAPLPDTAKGGILGSAVDTRSSEPKRAPTDSARIQRGDRRLRAFDEL